MPESVITMAGISDQIAGIADRNPGTGDHLRPEWVIGMARNTHLFEKYDEAARRSIFFARYEAYSREYVAIRPEHILLGILREEDSKPSPTWPPNAPPVSEMRADLDKRCWPVVASAEKRDIPLTVESRRVLLAANACSERLGHTYVGVGHLLLGLLAYQPHWWTLIGVRFSTKRYLRRRLSAEVLEAHVRKLSPDPKTGQDGA